MLEASRRPKQMSSVQKRPTLKQQYMTPSDVNLPDYIGGRPSRAVHSGVPLVAQVSDTVMNIDSRRSELDGFYLLESTGMGFPEDAQQAILSDRKLVSVVADDFTFFTELLFLDVSENFLTLEPFGAFPKLRELRLACNGITGFREFGGQLAGFESLLCLDLSYNKLTPDSVQCLAALPCLAELDLSGNDLRVLPAEMGRFARLERLLLDYNKMESNQVFLQLAPMPALRQASLANNFLSQLPEEAGGGLRLLELLDLSFNYFAAEASVELLAGLPRLLTVMLYGNPLLGPTGEDPLFIYIEGLLDRAAAARDASGSSLKDVEFLTEIPRKRCLKKGQSLGRQALYRDFAVVQVDASVSVRTTKEWRMRGAQTMFAEAMGALKKQQPGAAAYQAVAPAYIPDLTFLTGVNEQAGAAGQDADTDAIADAVMQRVAQEMGILNSAELLRLRDRVKLPPTAAAREQMAMQEGREEERDQEEDEEEQGQDRLPASIFGRQIHDPTALSAQPVSLKTAMKALSLALKQPLTDYSEVPSKFSLNSKEYVRATAASKARQLPRIAPSQAVRPEEDEDRLADRAALRYSKKGLSEPAGLKQVRAEQREYTLTQIDQVLDSLNRNTGEFTSGRPPDPHGHAAGAAQTKESMAGMRHFARPYQGLRSLLDMVDEVVDEFNK